MDSAPDYEFVDSGGGRRLERFAGVLVDRPAPGAPHRPSLPPGAWREASIRFDPGKGWTGTPPEDWRLRLGPATLLLRPAAAGQLGMFPEHMAACRLLERVASGASGLRVLNAFAHTGLATLWAASLPGVGETAHVDAAKGAVDWARKNAAASGLAERRVRWIRDDAMKFLGREARRGTKYDIVILDPPSFGRGPGGSSWKFDRDIDGLLSLAAEILSPGARALVATCHSPGWTAAVLGERLKRLKSPLPLVHSQNLTLESGSGGHALSAGVLAAAVRAAP